MSGSAQPAPAPIARGAGSRLIIIGELVLFGLIFAADYYRWHHLILISKTLYFFALAWLSLRLRGLNWKSVGLSLYRSWRYTLIVGVLLGIGNECLELFVTSRCWCVYFTSGLIFPLFVLWSATAVTSV